MTSEAMAGGDFMKGVMRKAEVFVKSLWVCLSASDIFWTIQLQNSYLEISKNICRFLQS
jgi:hypothetical protein